MLQKQQQKRAWLDEGNYSAKEQLAANLPISGRRGTDNYAN